MLPVVLFDNCEAFLEQRGSENMQHGAAFSIIIRALESYKGTLILTTNRGTYPAALTCISIAHFQPTSH